MRLVSYVFNEEVGAGLQSQSLEYIFPLAPLGYADTLSFLYAGEGAWAEAAVAASSADLDSDAVIRTDQADLLAPIAMPGKFICIGLNYNRQTGKQRYEGLWINDFIIFK